MKTIVLDATELARDYLCTGLAYEVLGHVLHATWFNVYVPASVFEEVVASHGRAVQEARRSVERLARPRRLLGLPPIEVEDVPFDYRAYLTERFDAQLGITVLPWPAVPHEELVARAVTRTPPFDEKGGGYRDSLVWADVVELARTGHDVALVSADRAFAGKGEQLAPALEYEVKALSGTVELVRDFGSWLVSALPWKAEDLRSAVAKSRDEAFYNYYLQSDLQDELVPTAEELGFRWPPYSCAILEVRWDGHFDSVNASSGPDGLTLVEYELDQVVGFTADFPEGVEPEPDWEVSDADVFRRVHVTGEVRMIVRIAVLFGEEAGFSVDQLSWRRADGTGPGAPTYRPENDPSQLSLLASASDPSAD